MTKLKRLIETDSFLTGVDKAMTDVFTANNITFNEIFNADKDPAKEFIMESQAQRIEELERLLKEKVDGCDTV